MMQQSTNDSETSVKSELRVDFLQLIEDLIAFHYEEANLNTNENPGSTTNNSFSSELIRNIIQTLTNLQKAQEATKKLTLYDLDVAAQEKLLLATASSCVIKRQLLHTLKTDLSKLS